MSSTTCATSSGCSNPLVDGAELGRLRPAQRRELVLAALRDGGRRLLEDARPGGVDVLYAETSDGVAVVLPAAAGGKLPPRAERLARAAAAALAEAADLPTPARAGDVEIEAARWEGQVALRIAHPAPREVLEILPLTLEDQAQELDRVRLEPVLLPAGDLDDTEPAPEERWLWRAEIAGRLGGRPGAAALAPEVEAAVASLEARVRRGGRGRPGHRGRPAASPPRRAPHAAPARRHGQVRRLPHGVPPPRPRLRGPRAGARARGRRGAAARRPAGREAVGGPAPRVARRRAHLGDPRAGRARHLRGAAAQPACRGPCTPSEAGARWSWSRA